MKIILDRRDTSLEYETDCLIIRVKNEPPRTVPLNSLKQLICMHNVHLTTQLIGQLLIRGIDFIVINQRYAENGFSIFADQQKDAIRRSVQYTWQQDPMTRIQWSQRLLASKLKMNTTIISQDSEKNASRIKVQLTDIMERMSEVSDEATLRGLEGAAQKLVFAWWRDRLPAHINFTKRTRRPPEDPLNATLSFAYYFGHEESVRQLKAAGLDPQLGLYHRLVNGRMALACDIMEPIRPLIEAWVFKLFICGDLDNRHFTKIKKNNGCYLGKEGRKRFYEHMEIPQKQWSRRLLRYARIIASAVDDAAPSHRG